MFQSKSEQHASCIDQKQRIRASNVTGDVHSDPLKKPCLLMYGDNNISNVSESKLEGATPAVVWNSTFALLLKRPFSLSSFFSESMGALVRKYSFSIASTGLARCFFFKISPSFIVGYTALATMFISCCVHLFPVCLVTCSV